MTENYAMLTTWSSKEKTYNMAVECRPYKIYGFEYDFEDLIKIETCIHTIFQEKKIVGLWPLDKLVVYWERESWQQHAAVWSKYCKKKWKESVRGILNYEQRQEDCTKRGSQAEPPIDEQDFRRWVSG